MIYRIIYLVVIIAAAIPWVISFRAIPMIVAAIAILSGLMISFSAKLAFEVSLGLSISMLALLLIAGATSGPGMASMEVDGMPLKLLEFILPGILLLAPAIAFRQRKGAHAQMP